MEQREAKGVAQRAPVALLELVIGLEGAGEDTVGEGAVGHDADAVGGAVGNDLVGVAAVEHVVADLVGHDRGDGEALVHQSGGEVGDADVADLALGLEVFHSPHRFVPGSVEVGPVDEVDVDVVGAEGLEAEVALGLDGLGASVADEGVGVVGLGDDAGLGNDDDVVPVALEGVAHEGFGGAEAVGDGGVEEGDAEVEGAADGGGGQVVVDGAVAGAAHGPAAEAESGNLGAGVAELAVLHGVGSLAGCERRLSGLGVGVNRGVGKLAAGRGVVCA